MQLISFYTSAAVRSQSLHLWPKAKVLRPVLVILSLISGNSSYPTADSQKMHSLRLTLPDRCHPLPATAVRIVSPRPPRGPFAPSATPPHRRAVVAVEPRRQSQLRPAALRTRPRQLSSVPGE